MFLKRLYKKETERTLPNLFYEDTVNLNHTTMKENYRIISLMNIDAKKFNKNTSKPNARKHQKDHPPWASRSHSRDVGIVQHMKIC